MLHVYNDLSLVFWNTLFYNEPISLNHSKIAMDASSLKVSSSLSILQSKRNCKKETTA